MVEPALIKAAQSGDRDALITLLREIETQVYRTAYYILNNEQDALDASQEALIRIYTKIGSYEEKALFKTGYSVLLLIFALTNLEEINQPYPLMNMIWFSQKNKMLNMKSFPPMWHRIFARQ